jgi:hypothetical protein
MINDKAQTSGNSEVAATIKKQMIERNAKGDPAPAAAQALPPWTAAFDLPSIRFPEPKRD